MTTLIIKYIIGYRQGRTRISIPRPNLKFVTRSCSYTMSNKPTFVELFAGCGGTSLGLEAAGFSLLFANEQSPMAAETYAYNFLGENLDALAKSGGTPKKVFWIKSQYPATDLKSRLKEDPRKARELGGHSDLPKKVEEGSLLIGDINRLLNRKEILADWIGKVDLVAGGPPCQGFSLAGLRQHDDARNKLPYSFIELATYLNPKVILFENVLGILHRFINGDGKEHFAWFEVAKLFAQKGYVPLCARINSCYLGLPQSRPRFIITAYRKDVLDKIRGSDIPREEEDILESSTAFFNKVSANENVVPDDLEILNNAPESVRDYNACNLFPKATGVKYTVKSAIKDLSTNEDDSFSMPISEIHGYPAHLLKVFDLNSPNRQGNSISIKNHERRAHSALVRSRFRLLQLLQRTNKEIKQSFNTWFGGENSTEAEAVVVNFLENNNFFFENEEGEIKERRTIKADLPWLLQKLRTKKHSQKALIASRPAPTQVALPDDFCHYSLWQPRTLTVREVARIQTFPDWFEFRSKPTTGGVNRKFQVPQYTQAGNAVPPLLAKLLGEHILKNLSVLSKSEKE